MTVDKIGKLNDLTPVSGPSKASGAAPAAKAADSVSISSDALKKAEIQGYIDIVQNAPDVRTEKVEQARRNLAAYMQDSALEGKVIDRVAQLLTQLLR